MPRSTIDTMRSTQRLAAYAICASLFPVFLWLLIIYLYNDGRATSEVLIGTYGSAHTPFPPFVQVETMDWTRSLRIAGSISIIACLVLGEVVTWTLRPKYRLALLAVCPLFVGWLVHDPVDPALRTALKAPRPPETALPAEIAPAFVKPRERSTWHFEFVRYIDAEKFAAHQAEVIEKFEQRREQVRFIERVASDSSFSDHVYSLASPTLDKNMVRSTIELLASMAAIDSHRNQHASAAKRYATILQFARNLQAGSHSLTHTILGLQYERLGLEGLLRLKQHGIESTLIPDANASRSLRAKNLARALRTDAEQRARIMLMELPAPRFSVRGLSAELIVNRARMANDYFRELSAAADHIESGNYENLPGMDTRWTTGSLPKRLNYKNPLGDYCLAGHMPHFYSLKSQIKLVEQAERALAEE